MAVSSKQTAPERSAGASTTNAAAAEIKILRMAALLNIRNSRYVVREFALPVISAKHSRQLRNLWWNRRSFPKLRGWARECLGGTAGASVRLRLRDMVPPLVATDFGYFVLFFLANS